MRKFARIALLASLAACGGGDAATPTLTPLSPDESQHIWPSYSPDGSKVAYWGPADAGAGLVQAYVANADFSNPVKLPMFTGFNGMAPIWSPDGSQIAATSSQFGTADVVVAPAAGGEGRRITMGAGVELPTTWYADGDRLGYVASTEGGTFGSFVVSISTGVSRPLVPSERRANFGLPSPDGSHVVLSVIEGPRSTLWVADSSGANARQLTTEGFETFGATGFMQPWSPDGKEVLYESRRTGTSDLWIAPIDGGPHRQLTRDIRNDYFGAWSGDGKWIAFLSDRGKQVDAWVVPAAGGAEQRITDSPVEERDPPSWRGRTNELAIVTSTARTGLWSLDLETGKELRLTADSIRPGVVAASPDGKQIAFVVERGGGIQDLLVGDISGGAQRVVFAGGAIGVPGQPCNSTWSPSGSHLAVFSDRGGSYDIWIADAAGGAPRQLTNWSGFEYCPVWSADGSSILFVSDHDTRLGDVWRVGVTGGEPTRVSRLETVGVLLRSGSGDLIAGTISTRGGQFSVDRIRPDGRANIVWNMTTVFPAEASPSGDSLLAGVEQADGRHRTMILASNGGGGRVILQPSEGSTTLSWSPDGNSIAYSTGAGGASDIGLLNRVDGTTRRLTTTPEHESSVSFTPDGKSIVFRRSQTVQRVNKVDLTKLLAAPR